MPVKAIFCGDRGWTDSKPIQDKLSEVVQRFGRDVVIWTGGCNGADNLAHLLARKMGLCTPVMWAEWRRLGKQAGPERNLRMLYENPLLTVAYKDDFDWTLERGLNGGHTEGMVRISVVADVACHVYSQGRWVKIPAGTRPSEVAGMALPPAVNELVEGKENPLSNDLASGQAGK